MWLATEPSLSCSRSSFPCFGWQWRGTRRNSTRWNMVCSINNNCCIIGHNMLLLGSVEVVVGVGLAASSALWLFSRSFFDDEIPRVALRRRAVAGHSCRHCFIHHIINPQTCGDAVVVLQRWWPWRRWRRQLSQVPDRN